MYRLPLYSAWWHGHFVKIESKSGLEAVRYVKGVRYSWKGTGTGTRTIPSICLIMMC